MTARTSPPGRCPPSSSGNHIRQRSSPPHSTPQKPSLSASPRLRVTRSPPTHSSSRGAAEPAEVLNSELLPPTTACPIPFASPLTAQTPSLSASPRLRVNPSLPTHFSSRGAAEPAESLDSELLPPTTACPIPFPSPLNAPKTVPLRVSAPPREPFPSHSFFLTRSRGARRVPRLRTPPSDNGVPHSRRLPTQRPRNRSPSASPRLRVNPFPPTHSSSRGAAEPAESIDSELLPPTTACPIPFASPLTAQTPSLSASPRLRVNPFPPTHSS